jgi:hypothetical protein
VVQHDGDDRRQPRGARLTPDVTLSDAPAYTNIRSGMNASLELWCSSSTSRQAER